MGIEPLHSPQNSIETQVPPMNFNYASNFDQLFMTLEIIVFTILLQDIADEYVANRMILFFLMICLLSWQISWW